MTFKRAIDKSTNEAYKCLIDSSEIALNHFKLVLFFIAFSTERVRANACVYDLKQLREAHTAYNDHKFAPYFIGKNQAVKRSKLRNTFDLSVFKLSKAAIKAIDPAGEDAEFITMNSVAKFLEVNAQYASASAVKVAKRVKRTAKKTKAIESANVDSDEQALEALDARENEQRMIESAS